MINGGGGPAQNYQSHLLHVRQLAEILRAGGLPVAAITVFSADGLDPAPDLAVRDAEPTSPDGWWLRGTVLEGAVRPPLTLVNSELPGLSVRPATPEAVDAWFNAARSALRPGDTILLFVTDHGERGKGGPDDNSITLWGTGAALTVRQLQDHLRGLPPGVRVVALMSQCFSGGFANLMNTDTQDGLPAGNVCGYFASTAERPAYGCYPENRGRENVGYAFHVLQALADTGSLPEANRRALVDDSTPDVPLRTSDVFLAQQLAEAARSTGQSLEAFVDALLDEAWRTPATWEPEIRLLDRIAATYGCPSPRSLVDLAEQARELPTVSAQMHSVAGAWGDAVRDANRSTMRRFLNERAEWAAMAEPAVVTGFDGPARQHHTAVLLTDLRAFAARTGAPNATLNDKEQTAAATAYRMEVRLAVVLRLRAVLTDIAGRAYMATRATEAQRAAYDRLRTCERLDVPHAALGTQLVAPPAPLPPFEDDVRAARATLPAWLGVRFQEVPSAEAGEPTVGSGAATVLSVFPQSPAATGGLAPGDIILGPPGAPFGDPRELRTWVMLSPIGKPRPLEVLRNDRRSRVTIVPAPYPIRWPELPGPPRVGATAPALHGRAFRGTVPRLAAGRPHLLFFWATWCAPCKAALPEVLAFERQTGTPVIAVTDEPAARLEEFLRTVDAFPATVVSDPRRRSFVEYAVGGTPTFVLVDGSGRVASYATGYRADQGLPLPGWQRHAAATD